jgi:hypothetical protein
VKYKIKYNYNLKKIKIKDLLKQGPDLYKRKSIYLLLKLLNVNLHQQVNLIRLSSENYNSKILKIEEISPSINVKVDSETYLEHNFNSRYKVTLSNVVYDALHNLIYVFNSENELFLLQESTDWPSELQLINSISPKNRIKTKIKFGTIGISGIGHYHQICDNIPLLLEKSQYPRLVYTKSLTKYSELLKILGIEFITVDRFVRVDTLEIFTVGRDTGFIHPHSIENLKIIKSVKKVPEVMNKLYISRRRSRRSITSEILIEEAFKSNGYSVICVEDFSIMEQISIFSRATHIGGLHGAGLVGAVWSNEGTNIIEIITDAMNGNQKSAGIFMLILL